MREQIQGLAADVRRLLMTGSAAAIEDASLRRRAKAVRDLAAQVPALAPLADAADRVTHATPRDATAALLQLHLLVHQVCGGTSQAAAELAGKVEPLERTGSWFTGLRVAELSPLYEALRKPDDTPAHRQARRAALREALARYLGDEDQADLRLLPLYLDRLDDEDETLTDRALPAYGPAVIGELRRGLDLQGDRVHVRKFAVLCRLEPKLGRQLCQQALAEGNWMFQVQAMKSLSEIDPQAGERTALKLLDEAKTPQVLSAALASLWPSKSDAALDRLLKAAVDKGPVHPMTAGASEGLRKSQHPRAGHRLLEGLKAAVAELVKLTPPPPPKGSRKKAPPLSKPEAARRSRAQETVRRFSELLAARADMKGIETILELLKHPLEDVRAPALDALSEIGPNARAAVPLLTQGLESDSEDVRAGIADCLGAIGPAAPESLPALVRLLEDKEWWVQTCALDAIEQFNEMAVGPLSEALQSDNPQVRATAAGALGNLAEHALPVLRDLLAVTRDPSGEVRNQTAFSLGQIGEVAGARAAPMVVPALVEMTRDKDKEVQRAAFLALRDFGPDARLALPALLKSLKDKSSETRQMSLWVLESMGPEARDALPEVRKLVKDRSSNVRDAARAAIDAIEGE